MSRSVSHCGSYYPGTLPCIQTSFEDRNRNLQRNCNDFSLKYGTSNTHQVRIFRGLVQCPSENHLKLKFREIAFAHKSILIHPGVLKCSTECGSDTVVLCTEFQTIEQMRDKLWSNKIWRELSLRYVSDECSILRRNAPRLGRRFDRVSSSAIEQMEAFIALVPWRHCAPLLPKDYAISSHSID